MCITYPYLYYISTHDSVCFKSNIGMAFLINNYFSLLLFLQRKVMIFLYKYNGEHDILMKRKTCLSLCTCLEKFAQMVIPSVFY